MCRVSAVEYDRSFFLLHLESGSLFFEGCRIRYSVIARGHCSVDILLFCRSVSASLEVKVQRFCIKWDLKVAAVVCGERERENE